MTCEELDAIRLRWHPEADATRAVQDTEDVRELLNYIDSLASAHVVAVDFIADVAESGRPLAGGLVIQAMNVLDVLGMPRAVTPE